MENKKNISIILLTLAIIVPIFIALIPITSSEVQPPSPMMLGPEFRDRTVPMEKVEPISSGLKSAHTGVWQEGDIWYWLVYDDWYGYLYNR